MNIFSTEQVEATKLGITLIAMAWLGVGLVLGFFFGEGWQIAKMRSRKERQPLHND